MDDDDEADAIAAATRALESRVFVVARERVDGGGEDARGAAATAAAVASRLQLHRDDSSSSRSVVLCRSTATYRALARRVPREGERCADVGSAHGDATAALAAAVGDASLVVGVDVSAAFVELSRSRHPTIRFERLDALEDPALLARHLAGAACVFVDVGGVRPAEALVRLLPSIAKSADPRVVVVKCEALYDEAVAVAAAAPHPDDVKCEALYDEAVAVVAAAPHPDDALNERPLPMRFWNDVCVRETKNVRARSAFKRTHEAKSAAPAAPGVFDRYPLKYPPRFVTSAADGVTREACRFHNYSKQGCLKRIRGDACPHDHERCHWCGEAGHVASACDDARRARDRAVVSEGLAPGAAPIRDPNDGTAGVTSRAAGVTSRAAITSGDGDAVDDDDGYVYVAGGRNRGRTVGVTERYSIARGRWERGPHMEHPRGSHALAACGGVVYAVAGGGVKSNLGCAEALRAVASTTDHPPDAPDRPRWTPAGSVRVPRHAVAGCSVGDWGVCATGGWANGDACVGAVEFLDLRDTSSSSSSYTWRSLAPLNTPRKLHAAAGLSDGRVYVFGGRVSDDARVGPTSSAEAYDPAADEWRYARDLPTGACACACVDEDDVVYVLTWGADKEGGGGGGGGGKGGLGAVKEVSKNRAEKNRRKAEKAAAKAAAAAEGVGGDRDAAPQPVPAATELETPRAKAAPATTETGALWRYDTAEDAYALISPLPLPEWYGFACAAKGGRVYAIGGSTVGRWTGAAFRIDVRGWIRDSSEAPAWEALPDMKMVRRRAAAAAVDAWSDERRV